MPFKLFYQNLITSTGITSGSTASGFDATNAASLDLFAKWRSTSSTGAGNFLEYDFGSTAPGNIDGVILIGSNMADTGTWRVRFDDSTAYTSTAGDAIYDSGTVAAFDVTYSNPLAWRPPAGRDAIHLPSSTAATGWPNRYLRVDQFESTSGYVEASLLWAGPLWSPNVNVDSWEQTYLYRGSRVVRNVTASFNWLTLAKAAELTNVLGKLAGMGRAYLLLQSTADETWLAESMLCTVNAPRVMTVDKPNLYRRVSVTFTEADY